MCLYPGVDSAWMKLRHLIPLALLLSACTAEGEVTVSTSVLDESPITTTTSPASASAPTGVAPEVDLVTFVAAVEDAMAGTSYEGQALEAPEVFLATGRLFCEELDAGSSADEVLTDYLEALTGSSIEDAAPDDLHMAGGVLGVGLATLCPQHLGTFTASS